MHTVDSSMGLGVYNNETFTPTRNYKSVVSAKFGSFWIIEITHKLETKGNYSHHANSSFMKNSFFYKFLYRRFAAQTSHTRHLRDDQKLGFYVKEKNMDTTINTSLSDDIGGRRMNGSSFLKRTHNSKLLTSLQQ